jgi:tagatose 1,6-diphosphate aldolase
MTAFGILRGLDGCSSTRGTFTILALDHRQNLRRELRPGAPEAVTTSEMIDFKRAVVRAIGDAATGVLLDPEIGAAQCIADGSMPGHTGLVVAVEATGYLGPSTARVSRVLEGWSVASIRAVGASAAKLLVYYHPDAPNASDQEALVARVARECAALGLPLFLEPLGFALRDGEKLTGEARRRVVVETARRLTDLGPHVLKAEFPYDAGVTDRSAWADACAELEAASRVPWSILSGGVDAATFEAQVRIACEAGASGVVAGRSVWAEAATLPPAERDVFLATEARARLAALAAIVDASARPWRATRSIPVPPDPIAEDWYRRREPGPCSIRPSVVRYPSCPAPARPILRR